MPCTQCLSARPNNVQLVTNLLHFMCTLVWLFIFQKTHKRPRLSNIALDINVHLHELYLFPIISVRRDIHIRQIVLNFLVS
jgi:hypothetical protein